MIAQQGKLMKGKGQGSVGKRNKKSFESYEGFICIGGLVEFNLLFFIQRPAEKYREKRKEGLMEK